MTFKVGQRVRLKHTGEVGVIVCLWIDEHGDQDSYIAFLGTSFPMGMPTQKPYVLRYFTAGLELVE